jgi:hypothetical protein
MRADPGVAMRPPVSIGGIRSPLTLPFRVFRRLIPAKSCDASDPGTDSQFIYPARPINGFCSRSCGSRCTKLWRLICIPLDGHYRAGRAVSSHDIAGTYCGSAVINGKKLMSIWKSHQLVYSQHVPAVTKPSMERLEDLWFP